MVHILDKIIGFMANKCSVCGRPVAGHAKLGCLPGPGNCTLPPLTPSSRGSVSEESGNSDINISSADSMATTAQSTSVSQAPPVSSVAPSLVPTSETPSTSQETVILSNEQLEKHLSENVAKLQDLLSKEEDEAKSKRLENISKLYEKEKELQSRLQVVLEAKAKVASAVQEQTPVSSVSGPPNPFSLPATTAPGSASSFGVLGRLQPNSHALSQSASTTPATLFPPSSTGQSALTTPTMMFPPLSSGASMPDIRAASCAATGVTFSTSRIAQPVAQPLAHAQSLPNVNVNMAAFNPNIQPFITPDDIFQANPIARAMLGLQADARDDAQKLGKYIPELYSLRYGKIEEIRHKMSYSEFMYMFTRMLTFMLKDDPHLVPDRILFLNNVCAKAAKFRWSDVRNCYCVALTEIKRGYRAWGDDWKELTEEYLDSVPKFRQSQAPQAQRYHPQSGKTVFTPGKPPCNDFNDSECCRSVCKFDHRCRVCS